jgi:hypothetical protein
MHPEVATAATLGRLTEFRQRRSGRNKVRG